MSDHLEECPDLNIDCPDKSCIIRSQRKSNEAHHQQCSKEIISCEYADLGCKHVCLRESLLYHRKQQVHTHLQLAMNARKAKSRLKSALAMLFSSRGALFNHFIKMASFSEFIEKEGAFMVMISCPLYKLQTHLRVDRCS